MGQGLPVGDGEPVGEHPAFGLVVEVEFLSFGWWVGLEMEELEDFGQDGGPPPKSPSPEIIGIFDKEGLCFVGRFFWSQIVIAGQLV